MSAIFSITRRVFLRRFLSAVCWTLLCFPFPLPPAALRGAGTPLTRAWSWSGSGSFFCSGLPPWAFKSFPLPAIRPLEILSLMPGDTVAAPAPFVSGTSLMEGIVDLENPAHRRPCFRFFKGLAASVCCSPDGPGWLMSMRSSGSSCVSGFRFGDLPEERLPSLTTSFSGSHFCCCCCCSSWWFGDSGISRADFLFRGGALICWGGVSFFGTFDGPTKSDFKSYQ